MDQNQKGRIFYLDLEKTIAMFMIVLGHYIFALNADGIVGFPSRLQSFANGSIMAPAITIFFISSGALLAGKNSDKLDIKKFYQNRIKRIYPLFCIAYFIVFSIRFYRNGCIPQGIPKWKLLLSFIGMDGYTMYLGDNFYILGEWFLGAIICFYLLFPFFKKMMEKCPVVLAILTLGSYIWVNVFNPFQVFLERNLIVCFSACILGMYIGKYLKKIPHYIGIPALIVSLVLMYVPLNNYTVYISNILGILMYISIFYLADFIKREKIKLCAKKISNISYHVFLVHHVILLWYLNHFMGREYGHFEMGFLTLQMFVLVFIGAEILNAIYRRIGSVIEWLIDKIYNAIWKLPGKVYRFMKEHKLCATAIIAGAMGLIIYHKFLFGDYLYMSTYDATEQFWPHLSYLGEYLKTEGFPGWTFTIGIGEVLEYTRLADIFYLICILAGKTVMPYLFGWLQWIKIILAAVCMFLYLRKIKIKDEAAMFGSLAYAFSAIMIIRGNWYHYSAEMVYLALLLYFMECFFQKRRWKGLTIILFILFSTRGVYFLCLYSIIIFVYAMVRYLIMEEKKIKVLGAYIWRCIKVYAGAVLLSGFFWMPTLYSMLHSARVGKRNITKITFFSIKNLRNICNAILRMFRFDLVRNPNYNYDYHAEFLNSPLFYIGILAIFLIVFALVYSRGKERRLIAIFSGAAILYVCCPIIQFVLSGFIEYQYVKLSSAWIVAGMAACSAYGYQKAIIDKRLSRKIVLITAGMILGVLLLCYWQNYVTGFEMKKNVLIIVIAFIAVYIIALFAFGGNERVTGFVKKLLLTVMCTELVITGYCAADVFTTSDHEIMKSELESVCKERTALFDEIKKIDNSDFYRVSANEYFQYANPMLGNYYDTSYYNTYANSYAVFCERVVPSSVSNTVMGNGIDNNIPLESLFGCKYILKENGEAAPYGCALEEKYDGYDVYINPNAQGIGVIYNSILSEKTFSDFSEKESGLAMIHSVISSDLKKNYKDESDVLKEQMKKMRESKGEYEKINEYFITFSGTDTEKTSGNPDSKMNFVTTMQNAELALVISNEATAMDYKISCKIESPVDGQIVLLGSNGNGKFFTKTIDIKKGENKIEIKKSEQKIQYFVLRFSKSGSYTISELEMEARGIDEYQTQINKMFDEYIAERNEEQFELTSFTQNRIQGSVNVKGDRILLFTIPYNKGWSAYVDGKRQDIIEVDFGLMAVELSEGEHSIELKYERPFLKWGEYAGIAGIVLFAGAVVVEFVKRRKTNEKDINSSTGV